MKIVKEKPAPDFLKASELARHLRVTTAQLTNWVAQGYLPRPWVRPGERTRLWKRLHYEAFVRDGRWPKEAWREF